MCNKIRLLSIAMLLTIFCSVVFAVEDTTTQENFKLDIGTEYDVCKGVSNAILFSIINNANSSETFDINIHSDEWSAKAIENMFVPENQKIQQVLDIFIPFTESPLDLMVEATPHNGEPITKYIRLNPKDCYDFDVVIEKDSFEATECTRSLHKIILKNTGEQHSKFIVDLENLDWLKPYSQEVELDPGYEAHLTYIADIPCDVEGNLKENIYVTIDETQQTFMEDHVFTVLSSDIGMKPEIKATDLMINHEGGTGKVIIKNNANTKVSYRLSASGLDWISLDKNIIELEPKQQTVIIINAEPTEKIKEGVYSVELIATITGSDVEYFTNIDIYLGKGRLMSFFVQVLLTSGMSLLVAGLIIFLILKRKSKSQRINFGSDNENKIKDDDSKENESEDKINILSDNKNTKKEIITINKRYYSKNFNRKKKSWLNIFMIFLIFIILSIGLFLIVWFNI